MPDLDGYKQYDCYKQYQSQVWAVKNSQIRFRRLQMVARLLICGYKWWLDYLYVWAVTNDFTPVGWLEQDKWAVTNGQITYMFGLLQMASHQLVGQSRTRHRARFFPQWVGPHGFTPVGWLEQDKAPGQILSIVGGPAQMVEHVFNSMWARTSGGACV